MKDFLKLYFTVIAVLVVIVPIGALLIYASLRITYAGYIAIDVYTHLN